MFLNYRVAAISVWALLLSSQALGQSFPPLNGYTATDSSRIDVARINRAAEALRTEGVRPLVLFVEADVGDSFFEAERFLDEALERYGYSANGALTANAVALFIGLNPLLAEDGQRPLYLDYGSTLVEVLGAGPTDDTVADRIRLQTVIPRLVQGDFSGAIVAGLADIDARLTGDGAAALPQPPAAVTSPSRQPTSGQPAVRPAIWPWLFLLGAAILAYYLLKRRRHTPEDAGPSELELELQSLKSDLSALLIDLSSEESDMGDLYLPADPDLQTDMVLITDLLENERPELLQPLQEGYLKASATLSEVSRAFSQLSSDETATDMSEPARLRAQRDDLKRLLAKAREVEGFARTLTGTWQTLQGEAGGAEQAVAEARASLDASLARYQTLARSASLPAVDKTFSHAKQLSGQAQRALEEDKRLTASERSRQLTTFVSELMDATDRLVLAEQSLEQAKSTLDFHKTDGYTLREAFAKLEGATQALEDARHLLTAVDGDRFEEAAERTLALSKEATEQAETLIALHKQNTTRLHDLRQAGEALRDAIAKGAKTFDLVDDFAPSTWRDIRGNGTEAQGAADNAYDLYEEAKPLNELSGEQDFEAAAQRIDLAFAELERGNSLIATIEGRLNDLREARATARKQLELVEADLRERENYLQRPDVDRDVSDEATDLLIEADALLTAARLLLQERKPDWLDALAKIQKADALTDKALVQVRSEQQAMEHRRVRLASEKQEAEAAVSRVEKFVVVHESDMPSDLLRTLGRVRRDLKEAEGKEREAQRLQNLALAQALEAAAQRYADVERDADRLYEQAESNFKELEYLRQETSEAVARLQQGVAELSDLLDRHRLGGNLSRELATFARQVPPLHRAMNRADLSDTMERVKRLLPLLDELTLRARGQVREAEAEAQRRRELARRRREAQEWGRRQGQWGSGVPLPPPSPMPRTPRQSSRPSYTPQAPSAPLRLPRRTSGGGRSGGGWGGGGRSGGGW